MFSLKDKLKELYEYRNVMRSLVEKSLFGKYKNSALGFLWHFAMPMVYIVLCFFINTEVRDRSEYYWILVASGIMIFHMLSGSVAGGTTCFTGNSGIIKKMYIPKSVDVLGSVEQISSPAELDVKRYGVICSKGSRRGLLLPNLDGVDDVDRQIEIACRKGGIRRSEQPELSRFEVVRHY